MKLSTIALIAGAAAAWWWWQQRQKQQPGAAAAPPGSSIVTTPYRFIPGREGMIDGRGIFDLNEAVGPRGSGVSTLLGRPSTFSRGPGAPLVRVTEGHW